MSIIWFEIKCHIINRYLFNRVSVYWDFNAIIFKHESDYIFKSSSWGFDSFRDSYHNMSFGFLNHVYSVIWAIFLLS